MLEYQLVYQYSRDLYTEWQQSRDEGKNVEYLKDMCKDISKQDPASYNTIAIDLAKVMADTPVCQDYPYAEPSDLEGIRNERPEKRPEFKMTLTPAELENKLSGAWLGRISGCLLGKPIEGFMSEKINKLLKGTNNYPLSKYIEAKTFSDDLIKELSLDPKMCWADNIHGCEPVDDDTNYTVLALKMIEQYGKDFRPNDVLENWQLNVPILATFTAERAAYRNTATGMFAPETAMHRNPFREWIGAQIRGDFYGYVNPADCEKAAEYAWRDACVSHVRNGIYGEMFIAAMLSAAAVCDDVSAVITAGLAQIPEKSRLTHSINEVLEWHKSGTKWEEIVRRIHDQFDENDTHGWTHTIPNAMIVTAALLYGDKDFGKSICLAVGAAFDTDCNGATVGSLVGMLIGAKAIPSYWTDVFGGKLATSIAENYEVSVPDLVKRTIKIING